MGRQFGWSRQQSLFSKLQSMHNDRMCYCLVRQVSQGLAPLHGPDCAPRRLI